MTSSDHEFGGFSTDLKLDMIEKYLNAFTTALRHIFKELWYIDAFAGTGVRTIRQPARAGTLFESPTNEKIENRRGSAKIAIDADPAFDKLIFIDKDPRHVEALKNLAQEYSHRKIDVINGDANDEIQKLVKSQNWTGKRAVLFLDPYGMNVDWKTLEAIRSTEAIDVWYLVSLSGLFRQAARDRDAVDKEKSKSLTRMLGTKAWEAAWYQPVETTDLLGPIDEKYTRLANVDAIEKFFWNRLKELFPQVLKPMRLNDNRGIPQFSLFFAISNPEPKAIGLATKIANHILNSGKASQVRPR